MGAEAEGLEKGSYAYEDRNCAVRFARECPYEHLVSTSYKLVLVKAPRLR